MKVGRSDSFSTYYVDESRKDASKSFNLAYLSIPILLNYYIDPKFTINAVPQYNILIYSNENLMYTKHAFKTSDFGIRGGVQFAPSSTHNLFAGYYHGFYNVNNIDTRYEWKNRQFQFGINVTLFNGK